MFVQMFLGHILGDYFFQNNWMAKNKSKEGLIGWIAVTVHTVLYTFAICLFMWTFNPWWIIAVFLSHIFIDRYSLAKWFMSTKYKGLKSPQPQWGMDYAALYWIIYIAIDNGAHLMLMYLSYHLIF